jgi:CubicO group peptidase (beta-lactamase class C family)
MLGLAAVALNGPSLHAQTSDSLTHPVAQAIAEERLVGATWALVTPAGTSLGAAGLKNALRNTPMSPHDRVQIGSVTKTFIATGILRLVSEGRVSLDAPVSRYLRDVAFDNPWEATSPLLVRHLLDHTGGLDDARMWQAFSLQAKSDAPLRAGLVRSNNAVRVRHRPGDRSSYSNTSYLLLGMLIEAVTRTRYETWLDTTLLAPLGMTRSTFAFVTQAGPGGDATLAMGHFDPGMTSAAVASHLRPASQFTTTAQDMGRFARFLMSDGRVDGRVLVDSVLLRAMAMPTTTEAARAGLAAGYALGLQRRDRHGVVGRCHLGNIGTFRAALCLFPEQQRAFFISYNSDPEGGNFDRVDAMLVRALGVRSPPETQPQPPSVDPARWEGAYVVRPNRFAQFAYLDEVTGVTRVRWDGQRLHLLPFQGASRALIPVGGASFRAADRVEATHVLLRSDDDHPIITDGVRTYERVRPIRVSIMWVSAAAGIVAVLYLLIVGGVRSARALRVGTWHSEPLRWPTLCLMLLLVAPLLYLTQSFLAIGDRTPANVVIALLTGIFPFTLVIAGVNRIRTGLRASFARRDLLVLAAALQWCAVLGVWGLLPLVLWR